MIVDQSTRPTAPEALKPDVPAQPSAFSMAILLGLTARDQHVYGGTAPEHVVSRRRAKNRTARRSRRINRVRRCGR